LNENNKMKLINFASDKMLESMQMEDSKTV